MSNTFTVAGAGQFPVDMLRYDECEFVTPEDRTAAEGGHDKPYRRVTLHSEKSFPTIGRWISFGWSVIKRPDAPREFDDAIHIMEVQGGSFVKSLANCWYAADTTNRAILRAAFAKYFDEYEARYRASAERVVAYRISMT